MNLRQKYTEETGKDVNRLPYQSICSVTTDYVEWLEQQLRQYNVVRQSEQFVCRDCEKKTKEYKDNLCEPCHKWHTN